MVTKNSKGRQNFLGTDIRNLYLEKLRLAAVYRRAEFRDDTMTFPAVIKHQIWYRLLPVTGW